MRDTFWKWNNNFLQDLIKRVKFVIISFLEIRFSNFFRNPILSLSL
jgi:hypothetical protein